jgi:hypothetical protein
MFSRGVDQDVFLCHEREATCLERATNGLSVPSVSRESDSPDRGPVSLEALVEPRLVTWAQRALQLVHALSGSPLESIKSMCSCVFGG